MKRLLVLGMGCAKCDRLEEMTRKAAEELGIEFTLEKVADIKKIMSYGVPMTPALLVDGEAKIVGRVPGFEELKKILSD